MASMSAKPEHDQDTSARLLQAAVEVFAEKGFGGATVKEIAERAGVNVSLISYHFNGKEGLFRTCLENFGRERLKDAEKILTPPDSVEDLRAKLKLWMLQFLNCHVEENNACNILHRENVMEHKFIWDVFQNTFLKAFEANAKFFEAAKKKGIVRKDIDPMVVAAVIFGALVKMGDGQEIQQKWLGTSIRDEKFRQHVADQTLNIILNGIT